MAQEVKGFVEHLDGFKRHLKLAIATFAAIVVLGVGFAYSLPDIYLSEGYILIEEASIPEQLLRSTVTDPATRQLTILNEKILTIPTMIRLVEEFGLYADERSSTPLELLAGKARMAIQVNIQQRESVSASGLPGLRAVGFKVSFEDESPEIAKAVADELVEMYLAENIKFRSEQTAETSDFLAGEVVSLEAEIGELEAEMAKFKEENADRLPSLNALNMTMLNRTEEQIARLEAELASLQQVRISVESQLISVDPTIPVTLADGSIAMSPTAQLKQLQTQLTVYQSRYSDDHPDVVATRRDIESLRTRFGLDADLTKLDRDIVDAKAELAVSLEKYSEEHPDVKLLRKRINDLERQLVEATDKQFEAKVEPDNPAYIQLQATLASVDADEKRLNGQIADYRAELAEYEERLMETPQVEKEMAALSRTLSSTSNRYWVMRDKQFTAEIGETLETESKGEELILLEPPRVPLRPYKPNRGAIVILSILFALVAGVGVTQFADALDRSIRSSASIVSVQGVPPLVEVPYIYTAQELAGAARMKRAALISVAPLILCVAVIAHFTILPLDVLWYSIANRIGF